MKSIIIVGICLLLIAPMLSAKGRYVIAIKQRQEVLAFAKAVLDPHVANELELKKLDNPFSAQKARLKK